MSFFYGNVMKNYLKKLKTILLTATLATVSFSSVAGIYEDTGYLTMVKVDIARGRCYVTIKYDYANGYQNGEWPCSNAIGQNMLALAKTAHILKTKVHVELEGNGEYSRPVYSIKLAE